MTVTFSPADSTDHTFTLDDDTVNQPVAAGEKVTVTVDLSSSVGFHPGSGRWWPERPDHGRRQRGAAPAGPGWR